MSLEITSSLPNLLIRLGRHLSRRRKRQFVLLLGVMLTSAFAEVVSLGAVLPFLGILVAPDKVFSHPIVADMAQAWGITSQPCPTLHPPPWHTNYLSKALQQLIIESMQNTGKQ